MYTLKRFLDAHGITRETFDQAVAKDTTFFEKWIGQGETEDDITIAPRAVDRLEEILAETGISEHTEKKEEKGSKTMDDNVMQAVRTANTPMEGSDGESSVFDMDMDQPTEQVEPVKAAKPRRKKEDSKDDKPRRKRSKNTLTREFIAEHGQADEGDIKSLRSFLMGAGLLKTEEVALMSDAEVQAVYKKDYYVISTATETYIFPRALLNSIKNEVYVVENNAE